MSVRKALVIRVVTRKQSLSVPYADRDFEPPCEEEDDEETIEVEEQQEGNDAESHRREIELLKEEGLLPLDQLLSTLKLPQVTSVSEPLTSNIKHLRCLISLSLIW